MQSRIPNAAARGKRSNRTGERGWARSFASIRAALEKLESRLLLSVFTVTNTSDSGDGSLRQAIIDANANPGHDTIAFSVGSGAMLFQPLSALPSLTDEAT